MKGRVYANRYGVHLEVPLESPNARAKIPAADPVVTSRRAYITIDA